MLDAHPQMNMSQSAEVDVVGEPVVAHQFDNDIDAGFFERPRDQVGSLHRVSGSEPSRQAELQVDAVRSTTPSSPPHRSIRPLSSNVLRVLDIERGAFFFGDIEVVTVNGGGINVEPAVPAPA